jgi:hypothetical protein
VIDAWRMYDQADEQHQAVYYISKQMQSSTITTTVLSLVETGGAITNAVVAETYFTAEIVIVDTAGSAGRSTTCAKCCK